MPFYVPVGPRGVVLRLGTGLIRILGSVSYWRASRRRLLVPVAPAGLRFELPEA
jgi:hypothetical protein